MGGDGFPTKTMRYGYQRLSLESMLNPLFWNEKSEKKIKVLVQRKKTMCHFFGSRYILTPSLKPTQAPENKPLFEKEIPNLETIIFRCYVMLVSGRVFLSDTIGLG